MEHNRVLFPKGTYVRVTTINGGDITSILLEDYRQTFSVVVGEQDNPIHIPAGRIKNVEKAELYRKPLMVPSVHLNGTAKKDLIEQILDVIRQLRKVQAAMAEATPHGRDYYVQTSQAIHQAMSQHVVRAHTINELITDYEEIVCKIDVQDK